LLFCIEQLRSCDFPSLQDNQKWPKASRCWSAIPSKKKSQDDRKVASQAAQPFFDQGDRVLGHSIFSLA
jgi:hypothetical protein